MAETVAFALGLVPIAWQLYQKLDTYAEGRKQRDTDIEAARVQLDIFCDWLKFKADVIAKVPLDQTTQDRVYRSTVIAQKQMNELAAFLERLDISGPRKGWKGHAKELWFPLERQKLKDLQQNLSYLNKMLEMAFKPFERHMQEQHHLRTDAGISRITELVEALTAQVAANHASHVSQPPPRPELEGPRALTPDEIECLQTFRLTQGDRDASYEWYKDRVDERVADTCEWFLSHENYQTWRHQRAGPLLVTADPGCGKSVLAKYLIDHELPRDARICYFFFKDQDQNKVSQALCAILHQLFSALPSLLQHAHAAWERNGKGLIHVTAELRTIFQAAIRDPKANNTILVFDALDECDPVDLKTLVNILNCAFLDAPAGFSVKCLMTGRPYEQVSGEFVDLVETFPQIRIPGEQESETIKAEVERVIHVRVRALAKKKGLSVKLENHLASRLLETSHRTYLWVFLVFEYLEEEAFRRTERGLDSILQSLPTSVNDAYEKILSRSEEEDFVRRALSLIIAAAMPLKIPELNVVLQLDSSYHSSLDLDLEEDAEFEVRLRQCCGLFLTIHDGRVYLLHQTAREFLLDQQHVSNKHAGSVSNCRGSSRANNEGTPRKWQGCIVSDDAELLMAEACVRYLLPLDPDIFGVSGRESTMKIQHLGQKHAENVAFLLYSVQHWEQHVRWAQSSSMFQSLIELLEFKDGCSERYWRLASFERVAIRSPYRRRAFASAQYQLHLAAALNHIQIVESLIKDGASLNAEPNDEIDPPLRHAAVSGAIGVVQLLLDKGADVNGVAPKSELGRTAVFATTTWASEKIVDLLLRSGADPNHQDRLGQTPLFFANSGCMAEIFLRAGAEVNATDQLGSTPLFKAVEAESDSVVSMLLQWGADPNARTLAESTPLFRAAQLGWWDGLQILLSKGANLNEPGPDLIRSAWSHIAERALERRPGTLEPSMPTHILHLVQKILVNDESEATGTTPLHIAAHHGLRDSVKEFLKTGSHVDARDEEQATALIKAACSQHRDIEILKLLLDAGADPNAMSTTITPLLAAVHHEWEDGAAVLLSAGADPDIETKWAGSPALHTAASFGLEAMLHILIDHGADVNADDGQGKSALSLARELGEDEIAKILCAAGAGEQTT